MKCHHCGKSDEVVTRPDGPYCLDCVRSALGPSDATACYRLLDHNDTIRADDEFLEDDCITWTLIGIQHRWNVGCYWHTALKPMRRILGDNETSAGTDTSEKTL